MGSTVYAYYPGCTLHTTAREYDVSTRLVSRALGLEIEELKDWTCCGASSAHSTDSLLATVLPARELFIAEEKGLPVVVACAMCFSQLKHAAHELENKTQREIVGEILGRKPEKIPDVVHLLQLVESKEDSFPLKKSLAGLRVACYYGCLLVRPSNITRLDDDENPQIMDRLIQKTGAETVSWGFKTECCGASMVFPQREIVLRLSYRILSQAKEAGADCVAVACPLCHSNLDARQREMTARYKQSVHLPVLYFTQLLGIAFGLSPEELLLGKHLTDPLFLLKQKRLI